jgi:hypothetical protein
MSLKLSQAASVVVALSCAAGAQAPANDEIAGAFPILPGVNPGGSANFFTNVGATDTPGYPTPGCQGDDLDVWFSYAPTAVGPHLFATCVPAGFAPGSLQSARLGVYDAGSLLPLACDAVGCAVQSPGDSGNQVKTAVYLGSLAPVLIRVASATGSTPGTFYLSAYSGTTNGGTSCATAAPIGDGEHFGTWHGDVPSGAVYGFPCSIPSVSQDVWFAYVAPTAGVAQAVLERAGFDSTNLAAFSGVCATATVVGCSSEQPNQVVFPVAAGATYLLRAARIGVTLPPPESEFVLSVRTVPAATNETCATPLTLAPGYNFGFTGTSLSEGGPATGCGNSVFDDSGQADVWFQYSPPVASRVEIRLHGGGVPTGVLYAGACAGSPVLACGDPLVTYAAAGASLRLRAGPRNFNARGPMSVELIVDPTPANDLCPAATPLALGANGPFPTAGAATDGTAPCASSARDVWFQFAAPTSGVVRVDGCGSVGDHVFSVQAACGSPAIACNDDAANLAPCASPDVPYVQFSVVAGQTYRVRAATVSGAPGAVVLNVSYRLRQSVAWTGGSVLTLQIDAGTPGAIVVNALTATGAGFPNGYFFGLAIPFGELLMELTYGPPFLATLDGSGGYSFTVGGLVAPLGVTLYGVAVTLDAAGAPLDSSAPASFTL